MSIRISRANRTECPTIEEASKCWREVTQFKIKVLNNDCGQAKPVYVHLFNLEDLIVSVYREYADDCDPMWSPLKCSGRCVCLTTVQPDVMLTLPGTYVFRNQSGEPFDTQDFAVERTAVHKEYAQLWLQQQAVCCCNKEGY